MYDQGPLELLERYRREADRRALETMVQAYRPLVASVCRRYLRDQHDVEDAVQQTFLKFVLHAAQLECSLVNWLTSAAQSSSIDLIRRASRERRRLQGLQHARGAGDVRELGEYRVTHELIASRVHEALLELDEPARKLIVERFYEKVPLREIAARENVAAGTISRRVAAAVNSLSCVLRDMGVELADELTVAEYFGDPLNLLRQARAGADELRFALDWRDAELQHVGPYLPGWNRTARVGVLVSYLTIIKPGSTGELVSLQAQVRSTGFLENQGVRFIGIIEPQTSDKGPVEEVLRDYELLGGLIDVTDADALKTLDLIILGVNMFISPAATRAISQAVHSGVGLLNEFWTGEMNILENDPHLAELMLSQTPIRAFHTRPTCGAMLPATTLEEHPLLPGLHRGDRLMTYGCGPIYLPREGTRTLITKDLVVEPQQHGIPGLGAARMPVCVVGSLGSGRVFVANVLQEMEIARHLSVSAIEYMSKVASWLVEPRRGGEIFGG